MAGILEGRQSGNGVGIASCVVHMVQSATVKTHTIVMLWRSQHCTLISRVVCQWELITRAGYTKSLIERLQRVERLAAMKLALLEWASAVLLLGRRNIIGFSLAPPRPTTQPGPRAQVRYAALRRACGPPNAHSARALISGC